MSTKERSLVTEDPWTALQQFTEARIALGRCGTSLPLHESLRFKLAHARARDAVHQPADFATLSQQFATNGIASLTLASRVADRTEYLTRPDKGRQLGTTARERLHSQESGYDLGIVVCDGLSAPAINLSAFEIIVGLLERIRATPLTVAPVCLVHNGRVAIGDEIGQLLGVMLSLVFIGERPGLTSPHSLGIYLTYRPCVGITDEARNCISNIRPGGMTAEAAIQKTAYLVESALIQKKTGVELKDNMRVGYRPLAAFLEK